MLVGNSSTSHARRNRSTISCRECHRRKQKCDRRRPCVHCIKRGKSDACLYQLIDDHMQPATLPIELEDQPNPATVTPQTRTTALSKPSTVDQTVFRQLGYANNTNGTVGIIHGLADFTSLSYNSELYDGSTANRYRRIIRQLPSRRHTDILVRAFFTNVAWHYDIVDEATFLAQLCQWNSLSYHQMMEAPDGLPADLFSFPALLFQVLALSLLFQPLNHDESLNDLKYAADMELSDRAAELSDAGQQLASSIDKSKLTLTMVQAGLMRASFEKNTGQVIEAWHSVGIAARDGQELGLHLKISEPTLHLRNVILSDHDLGCRVWLMLHLWDAHMAVVLGRPMATKVNPNDIPFPASWGCSSIVPDLPQPCDVILCGYHTAYKYLQDIHDLERRENGFLLVDRIHESILTNIANLPVWAIPQRSRSNEPTWLSAALETMFTNVHFVLFALHRPFVSSSSSSRHKAYYFATQILESQTRLFDRIESVQHKSFSLVFATFDATVLIAAIHIRFPAEFKDQFPAAKRNLEWSLDRLKLLQPTNDLASSAFNVVQQLHQKMLAVGSPTQPLPSLCRDAECDIFARSESEILQLNWDSILQPLPGNLLPNQTPNELLCDGTIGIQLGEETGSFEGLDYSELGTM